MPGWTHLHRHPRRPGLRAGMLCCCLNAGLEAHVGSVIERCRDPNREAIDRALGVSPAVGERGQDPPYGVAVARSPLRASSRSRINYASISTGTSSPGQP